MIEPEPLYQLEGKATPQQTIEVVVKNYGLYHELAARTRTLQEWARQVAGQSP